MSGEAESVVLCGGTTLQANQRCKYLRGDEGLFVGAGVNLCGKGKGMDAEEFSGEDCQEGDGKDPKVHNKGDSGETAGANPEVISNGGGAASIEEQDSQKSQSKEIACKIFRIQSKKYYIDVMENKRGRYIKVVEVSADGRKNKMNLSMATAAKLRNELKSFGDFYMSLGPEKEENVSGDGVLKKAIIVEKSKRYFLDFKTNGRVRFLLVSQAVWVGARVQIAIPALGIVEWRNNLTHLLEKFSTDEEEVVDELPEGSCLKAKTNKFYFDIERGQSGIFMRISGVGKSFRQSIIVPKDVWEVFRDIIDDYVVKMEEAAEDTDESEKEYVPLLGCATQTIYSPANYEGSFLRRNTRGQENNLFLKKINWFCTYLHGKEA